MAAIVAEHSTETLAAAYGAVEFGLRDHAVAGAMTEIWTQAALWMALALVATLIAIWLRVATALSEIVVGTVAQLIIGAALGSALLAADASWLETRDGCAAHSDDCSGGMIGSAGI